MRKPNNAIGVLIIIFITIIAASLVFSPNVNDGVDFINAKKESIPVIKDLPLFPHVPDRAFRLGLDLQGGIHLVYEADLSGVGKYEYDSAMEGLRDVIERRVNLFGITEPLVQTEGSGEKRRLIVELAGITDSNEAIRLIGQTPYLEFREQAENYHEIIEENTRVLESNEGELQDPFQSTPLTGRYLEKAELGFDQITQEPIIQLQFDKEGSVLFEELTGRNIGKLLAIYLDGQPLQVPVVRSAISGGRAQITGGFTIEEAQRVVRDLNAGALPVPITLLSQQSVGPTLGALSLQQSLRAGMFGLLLIVVFMIIVYRVPGLLASISLFTYLSVVLLLFKFIPVTLTLAGIGGAILSIGMAVDANILIFSRMKEELREGKGFELSVQEAFKRAWPSIRDGNITTLLVALILFWFGSSFVQGFALALSLGIVVSMVSAMVVTRYFLQSFSGTFFEKITWIWG